jgi:hypothetical protein
MIQKILIGALLILGSWALAQEMDADMDADILDDNVVNFHIQAGTGALPWNAPANPIRVHIGQVLRFYNDDHVHHQLHTSGSPCPHGDDFAPGQTYDCVITKKHNAATGGCYDHLYGPMAQVYIQAD